MKYKYSVRYIDGSTMTFENDENIDFHTLANTAIAFNDMYINMANVIYIQKQIIQKEGADMRKNTKRKGTPIEGNNESYSCENWIP